MSEAGKRLSEHIYNASCLTPEEFINLFLIPKKIRLN